MKRRTLLRHLQRHGCQVLDDKRGPHTKVWNPANGNRTTVPRHTEIKNGTARGICEKLGVPLPPEL